MNSKLVIRALITALVAVSISGCGAGAAFDKAKQTNTVIAYDQFLRDHPDSEYASGARALRRESFFSEAQAKNSIESYENYLREYSRGKFVAQALNAVERLRYEQAMNRKSLELYDEYLNKHPDGKYVREIVSAKEPLVFAEAKQKNSLSAYNEYLRLYPDGKYVENALEAKEPLLFEQASLTSTLDAYDSYLNEYPDGKFVSEAHSGRGKIIFTQAEQSPTVAGYELYLEQYPQGDYVDDVRKRLTPLRRSIVWNQDIELTSNFTKSLSLSRFDSKLIRLPLYYFVHLYTQAAKGQYIKCPYTLPEVIPLTLPTSPNLPPRPAKLIRGEFESGEEFKMRNKKALQEWEIEKQALIATHELNLSKTKSANERSLSDWQKWSQECNDSLNRNQSEALDPDRVFDWQQQAVRIVLSHGFSLDSLSYDPDQEIFNYTIKSKILPSAWKGKFSVPISKAQLFKSNLSDNSNLQLHFYINPTGALELRRVTDLATNTSADIQKITAQPTWLPSGGKLAQLQLRKLSVSSSIDGAEVTIDGVSYGPTPLTLQLAPSKYELRVFRAPLYLYNDYSGDIDMRSDLNLRVKIDKNSEVIPGSVKFYIGVEHANYTKLAADGKELPSSALDWACVRDDHTGLVWEVKTDTGGYRDKDRKYRWGGQSTSRVRIDSDVYGSNSNNEYAAPRRSYSLDGRSAKIYGDWNWIVNPTNSDRLCGFDNWRVPDLYELASLVRCRGGYYKNIKDGCRGHSRGATINIDYFPGTQSRNYWSASSPSHVGFKRNREGSAWQVSFSDGSSDSLYSSTYMHVRLVSSGSGQ